MWVCVHALSGLSLGTLAPLGVALTVICALALHLLLDLVPHWDYTRHRHRTLWASLDVAVSIAAVAALALLLDLPSRAVLAAVVSSLPDLDVFDAVLPGAARRRLFPSHWRSFPHGEAHPAFGIPVQVVVAFGSVIAVLASST
ncbi:MAG: hypothetical protein V1912_11820 [bacterium]